jgi:hypothetical protein
MDPTAAGREPLGDEWRSASGFRLLDGIALIGGMAAADLVDLALSKSFSSA